MVGGGIHFFPFSPRWLAMRGRNGESLAALAELRRRPEENDHVQFEWKGILADVRFHQKLLQREYPNSHPLLVELKEWASLFRSKYFNQTLVALAIPFFQQVCWFSPFDDSFCRSDKLDIVLWNQCFCVLCSYLFQRAGPRRRDISDSLWDGEYLSARGRYSDSILS